MTNQGNQGRTNSDCRSLVIVVKIPPLDDRSSPRRSEHARTLIGRPLGDTVAHEKFRTAFTIRLAPSHSLCALHCLCGDGGTFLFHRARGGPASAQYPFQQREPPALDLDEDRHIGERIILLDAQAEETQKVRHAAELGDFQAPELAKDYQRLDDESDTIRLRLKELNAPSTCPI